MTALDPPSLTVEMSIHVRLAQKADLPLLEWYGQYSHFRNLYRRAFREQQAGRRLMLIADCGGFPIGQIFIHMRPQMSAGEQAYGYLYSFRVMDLFRGHGIGSFLLQQAETALIERGYNRAAIAVAKNNPRATSLYERRGYRRYGEDAGHWQYKDHLGVVRQVHEPCWLLEKLLEPR